MIELFNMLTWSLYVILVMAILYFVSILFDNLVFRTDFEKTNTMFFLISLVSILIDYLIVR